MVRTVEKMDDLLKGHLLWDDYIDEEQDEMAWEEYDYSEQDWFNCSLFCLKLFCQYSDKIKKYISSSDRDVRDLAEYLYKHIEEEVCLKINEK